MPEGRKRASNPAVEQEGEGLSSAGNLKPTTRVSSNKNVAPSALMRIASSHPVSEKQQNKAFNALLKQSEAEIRSANAQTENTNADTKNKLAEAAEKRAETKRRNKAASAVVPSQRHKTRMEHVEFVTCVLSTVLFAGGAASIAISFAAEGNAVTFPLLSQWAPHLQIYGTGAATGGGVGFAVTRFYLKQIATRLLPPK